MRDVERLPSASGCRHHVTIYIAMSDDVCLTESHLDLRAVYTDYVTMLCYYVTSRSDNKGRGLV